MWSFDKILYTLTIPWYRKFRASSCANDTILGFEISICVPLFHYIILDLTIQWVEYIPLIMSQSPKFMMELALMNQFTTKHNILGNSGKYLNTWTKRGLKNLWNLMFNICITFSFCHFIEIFKRQNSGILSWSWYILIFYNTQLAQV